MAGVIKESDMNRVIRRMLKDLKVDLGDEFDKNFERQAYFSESWQRRKSPVTGRRSGTLLVDSGSLRRSVRSVTTATGIRFFSDLPYAAIHNAGGEIVVTPRMRKFFWAKYYEAVGGFGRKKDGSLRNDNKNRRLGTAADFWKAMAMKKAGSNIVIPRRQFIGAGPEVERIVRETIERDLEEYFGSDEFSGKFKFKVR